jgi:hypothetical protein
MQSEVTDFLQLFPYRRSQSVSRRLLIVGWLPLEAIESRAGRAPTAERKAELEEQLLRYCKFDTEAMVEIVRFFT